MQSLKKKLQSIKQYAHNSIRLLKMGWTKHPFLMVSLAVVSAVTSILPFAQSGVVAILGKALIF